MEIELERLLWSESFSELKSYCLPDEGDEDDVGYLEWKKHVISEKRRGRGSAAVALLCSMEEARLGGRF